MLKDLPPEQLDYKARVLDGKTSLMEAGKVLAEGGLPKGLNKILLIGMLFGVVVTTGAQAGQEFSQGNNKKGLDILKLFGAEFGGGLVGGEIGAAIATVGFGLLATVGITAVHQPRQGPSWALHYWGVFLAPTQVKICTS